MPNSTLPPDNYLGDPERTTGEFQDRINQLQNWVNTLQAELQALSGTTVREGAVRGVGGGGTDLREASTFGSAADVEADQNLQTTDSVSFSDVAADSGDFVDLKENGQDVLRNPGGSTDPGSALAFGGWRTPNSSRPAMLVVEVTAWTDGSTAGTVILNVAESGGTTNYSISKTAESALGANGLSRLHATTIIPAGGEYQLENLSDPTGENSIESVREFTL